MAFPPASNVHTQILSSHPSDSLLSNEVFSGWDGAVSYIVQQILKDRSNAYPLKKTLFGKALTKLKDAPEAGDGQLIQAIGKQLLVKIPTTRALANCAWAYYKLGIQNPALISTLESKAIERLSAAMNGESGQAAEKGCESNQDIFSEMTASFGKLGVKNVQLVMCLDTIADWLVQNNKIGPLYASKAVKGFAAIANSCEKSESNSFFLRRITEAIDTLALRLEALADQMDGKECIAAIKALESDREDRLSSEDKLFTRFGYLELYDRLATQELVDAVVLLENRSQKYLFEPVTGTMNFLIERLTTPELSDSLQVDQLVAIVCSLPNSYLVTSLPHSYVDPDLLPRAMIALVQRVATLGVMDHLNAKQIFGFLTGFSKNLQCYELESSDSFEKEVVALLRKVLNVIAGRLVDPEILDSLQADQMTRLVIALSQSSLQPDVERKALDALAERLVDTDILKDLDGQKINTMLSVFMRSGASDGAKALVISCFARKIASEGFADTLPIYQSCWPATMIMSLVGDFGHAFSWIRERSEEGSIETKRVLMALVGQLAKPEVSKTLSGAEILSLAANFDKPEMLALETSTLLCGLVRRLVTLLELPYPLPNAKHAIESVGQWLSHPGVIDHLNGEQIVALAVDFHQSGVQTEGVIKALATLSKART